MTDYKVGDRVRVRFNYDHYSGEETVMGVIYEDEYGRKCIDYDSPFGWDSLSNVTILEVLTPTVSAPKARFGVGDRVELTVNFEGKYGSGAPIAGERGVIIEIDVLSDQTYLVKFDNGSTNCMSDGWWVCDYEIKLVDEPAPQASVRRIIAADVDGTRFERDNDKITLYSDGDEYAEITVDQFREIVKALEV